MCSSISRLEHELDYQHMTHYWQAVGRSYDLGLVSFATGLVLMLFPREWTPATTIGFGIAALALAVELRWTSGTWFTRLRWKRIVKPHGQTLQPITLEELDEVSQSLVDPSAGGS